MTTEFGRHISRKTVKVFLGAVFVTAIVLGLGWYQCATANRISAAGITLKFEPKAHSLCCKFFDFPSNRRRT